MNGFLAPIAVQRTGDYDRDGRAVWQETQHLWYYSPGLKCWLLFPCGFRTNYASVPRLPIVYWYCGDRVYEEPAGHDFMYTAHGAWIVTIDAETGEIADPVFRKLSREEADDLFLEMLLLNVTIPEGMAHTMHKAVRWFGQSSWDDETNIIQLPEILNLEPPVCEPGWTEPLRAKHVGVPPEPLDNPDNRTPDNTQANANQNVQDGHGARENPA